MRCIRCGTQHTYRERRSTGHCKRCRHEFAFEPRSGSPLTDMSFKHAIDAVSDSGRLAWLERQLYYEVCRRVRRRRWLHRLARRSLVSLGSETFAELLVRWIAVHGEPAGRLALSAFAAGTGSERVALEVGEYGFDALVICADEAIVDFLLANGFHADHRCPVLSCRGYPAGAYEALIDGLRERPPSALIVVHDADWEGCELPARVAADPQWFAGVAGVNIVDAGLGPADARGFRGLLLEGSARDVLHENRSVEEATWLNTYRLELEAVRPRRLLTVLARVIRGQTGELRNDRDADDSSWWVVGAAPFAGDDDVG
jgi:hypothetical protein